MTVAQILTQFELQVSDMTELSSSEELAIFNRVYQRVCSNRPWEFLKKNFAGTQSTTLPYVSLPTDFGYVIPNYNYSGNNSYAEGGYALVGTTADPYEIIPLSDRARYVNANNKAYIDEVNNRLIFTLQPTAANSISLDYISEPDDLATTDTPAFPKRFHPILVYGMAAEDFILQLSDKAKSYAPENDARYTQYLRDMASWNNRAAGLM